MGQMFNDLEEAVTWLYVQGWRQNEAGEWRKGMRLAKINRSSVARHTMVCVVFEAV